ncbi:hypothetical protein EA462_17125 [Natrarchaeobius halalkaliphilus]|uniref:Uncharacterized protein n=1 Tax=Natrarchaeobius halalkaliphilus TaxID=1679091 RepID=A0A3N6LM76_9EURY|nr:hypothetical protein [Natrarchaeobius halalkaliphilus]RQG86191.1 hypothetical protein EA462_17125 [Natrarchaeobius halalkaliphilus]
MSSSPVGQFLGTFLVVGGVAIVVASMVSPPDPFTVARYVFVAVVVAAIVSAVLASTNVVTALTDRL